MQHQPRRETLIILSDTSAAYRTCFQLTLWLMAVLVAIGWTTRAHAAPTIAPVAGEIQYITIDTPGDHWSGGTIVVGGTIVILPRNLLIDLPANRLTLQQLYEQAPAECVANHETGLAKGDLCNHTGMGGIVSLSANRTNGGNVIAGDVFIEKAQESVTGKVTYISYTDGYFRVNGNPGDAATGVMVRLNDPTSRHTVQQGLGCIGGSPNCSPDPRFTLDPDNYTNVYTTGYPMCIPSTVARTFNDVLGLGAITAQSSPTGAGDVLCPDSNRPDAGAAVPPAAGVTAADSRRFAPLQLGDHVVAEGSFETVDGVRFLSAHTSMVSVAMLTDISRANQPDYLFLNEVFMEAPAFQNQRMRNMFIGFTSVAPADVLIWSLHRDPVTNSVHEFPLASTAGCDAAAGLGTCTGQAITVGSAWDIFRIRYDVDFGIGARADLDPCVQLNAEPRFGTGGPICPNSPVLDPKNRFNTNVTEMMGVLQPVAHEIQARTGRKLASLQVGGTPLITLDINGNEATNGQYLFPLGMNLGGLEVAEMNEIDLARFQAPLSFSGIPWNLDRRLGPGGCFGPCEATPQPLDPFPFEDMDPRLQAPPVAGLFSGLPQGSFVNPNYTATPLTRVSNRIFAYVDPNLVRSSTLGGAAASGNFNGDLTVLSWPPVDPAAQPIGVTPMVPLFGVAATPATTPTANHPPVAVADGSITDNRTTVTIAVLANDTDADGNVLSLSTVSAVTPAGAGTALKNPNNTVTFTPSATFLGTASFTYVVSDGVGGTATGSVTVTVNQAPNRAPVAVADGATTDSRTAVTIPVLANDTDADGDVLTVTTISAVTPAGAGTVVKNANNTITFTPNGTFVGTASFTYLVADGMGGTATGTVIVTVNPAPNRAPVANPDTANTGTTPVTINVLANDSDPDGDVLTISGVTQSTLGTVVNNGTTVTFTPAAGASGTATFTYTISDGHGGSATAGVTVNIQSADVLTTTQVQFGVGKREWRVSGLGTVNGATVTIHNGPTLTGAVIGTASVVGGRWTFRQTGSAVLPATPIPGNATNTISLESTAGGTKLAIPVTVVN
jgi:Big-like domain-containing protein